MKGKTKLKKGDLIICQKSFMVPGTGCTFSYFGGATYQIIEYLDKWEENAWSIELMSTLYLSDCAGIYPRSFLTKGWFSEKELFEKFDCIKVQRKKKLQKLYELY